MRLRRGMTLQNFQIDSSGGTVLHLNTFSLIYPNMHFPDPAGMPPPDIS